MKTLTLQFTGNYLAVLDDGAEAGTISALENDGHLLCYHGSVVLFSQHSDLVDWFAERGYRLVLA